MPRFLTLALLVIAVPASAQPQALGVFGGWGAFRDAGRCYAIAAPVEALPAQGWRPFLSVGHWPGRGGGGQLFVRLSREKRDGSAVLLRIDGRLFQLSGRGRDAWAVDRSADDEIMTAIRTGLAAAVETRSVGGAWIRDRYQLRGAATAIDAAALACLPGR